MFITETPTPNPGEQPVPVRYEFDAKRLPLAGAAMVEAKYQKLAGDFLTVDQIRLAAIQGGANAIRVSLWYAKTLVHAQTRIEDVNPLLGEIDVRASAGEIAELRRSAETNKALSEQQREFMLASIDEMAEDDPPVAEADEVAESPLDGSVAATG